MYKCICTIRIWNRFKKTQSFFAKHHSAKHSKISNNDIIDFK